MTLIHYVKRYRILIIVIALVILGGVYFTRGEKASLYDTVMVKRADVIQKVSVTGRVESDASVELAFEKGGRVITEPVSVGTRVRKGDVLVRLDSSELTSLRAQAKANLDYETANLAQITKGARTEDIAITEAKVASAKVAVGNATLGVVDKLRSVYPVVDDAIRNETDVLWRNPRTQNPELNVPVNDAKLSTDLPPARIRIEKELTALEVIAQADDLGLDEVLLLTRLQNAEQALSVVKEYLNDLALVVNTLTTSSALSQTTVDTYKANVATARTSVLSALTGLLAADKDMRSAKSALDVAQQELALKRSSATPEAIAAQEARVAGMKALLENYDAQIAKMTLIAPFAGVVTKQGAKLGETVAPNAPVVSLISDGKWKIEANVPEADVAKIALGNPANITLDAYGSDMSFRASVGSIDPAETVIEGVSTYKVTLFFTEPDERIRSGMTANIEIATDRRDAVLAIPSRSVTTKEGVKHVRILESGVPKEIPVELGLRGSDGMVEVLSGISEGQQIITFERTE